MTGSFSEESLAKFAELANQTQAADFAEGEDTYDFTRCVRPDGSFYGTRGKCRKGSETGAKEVPTKPTSRSEKVEDLRAKVKEAKAGGATRGQLAGLRGDLQGQERMRKIEELAKKAGKTPDEVIEERQAAADKKIKARIAERYPQVASKPKPKGGLGTKPETPEEKAQLRAEVNKLGRKPSQLKPEEKAAAAKRRGGPHAQALVESRGAWKDQEAVVKERKTELDRLTRALKIAEKAVKENRSKETVARYKLAQRAVAQQERFHAKAEKDLQQLQRQTSRLAKRNERAQMTPAQRKQTREVEARIREMG